MNREAWAKLAKIIASERVSVSPLYYKMSTEAKSELRNKLVANLARNSGGKVR